MRLLSEEEKICLNCTLLKCVDFNLNCLLFKGDKNKAQKDYYHKNKLNPIFCKKRYEQKKKWRKTPTGKESMRKTAALWRKKNPEKAKQIQRDYHTRNKEKRLAQARAYKKRKREEKKVLCLKK